MENEIKAGSVEEKKNTGIYKYLGNMRAKREEADRLNRQKFELKTINESIKQADANRELIAAGEELKAMLNDPRYPRFRKCFKLLEAEHNDLIGEVANHLTPTEAAWEIKGLTGSMNTLKHITGYIENTLNQYADLQKKLSKK